MNCTECISYIPGSPQCGRGIKIGKLPEKTVYRKWLQHTTANYGEKGGGERHFLRNVAGKMFDITDQILKAEKKNEQKEKEEGK